MSDERYEDNDYEIDDRDYDLSEERNNIDRTVRIFVE